MKLLLQTGGGKDSLLALFRVLKQYPDAEIAGMFVTITGGLNRVSMHGVREKLIEMQASSLGLKIFKSYIPREASNEIYIKITINTLKKIQKKHRIDAIIFGDIFLEDIRNFREEMLKKLDLRAIFPLWKLDSLTLAREFISLNFKAITVVVDIERLSEKFLCKEFDYNFLECLPDSVDPMGENGEFHTFVYNGPIFKNPVKFKTGDFHKSGKFKFCDLIPELSD